MLVLALVGPALLSPSSAMAQPANGAAKAGAAADLFKQGKAAWKAKKWSKAHGLFLRSFQVQPSYDTATNLGHAALKLGKHADAARYLSFSLRHFPPSENAKKRAAVEDLFKSAKREVTVLTVSVEPNDAVLRVDGDKVDLEAETLFLAPGQHSIRASAKGHDPKERSVTATRGGKQSVSLVLAKSTATPPFVDSGLSNSGSRPSGSQHGHDSTNAATKRDILPGVLIGGGVTLAGLAVGVGFTLSADGSESDAENLDNQLPGDGSCSRSSDPRCDELAEAIDSTDRKRNISYVGFGIAGAAALGTVAYIMWPASERAARVRPELNVAPTGAKLSLGGRF